MNRSLLCALILATHPAALPAQEPANNALPAGELLAAGDRAFQQGEWDTAADAFLRFMADFGGLPETKEAVAGIKPLLGICHVKQGKMEEGLPLLEEASKSPDLDQGLRGEIVFHAGLAAMGMGKADTARTYFGEAFQNPRLDQSRRMEALMLGGTTHVMEQNWQEAASFFQQHGGTIARHDPEAGGRVRILMLHALMQQERWDEAAATAAAIHRDLDHVRQIVVFASMLVSLGDRLLESDKPHQAIAMLRMVPTQHEIIETQNARLAAANIDLQIAVAAKNKLREAQLQKAIKEIESELAEFAKVPQFDSAARLRMATAYFQLQRIREACLILDQMVRQMEPDAIVESATASLMRAWMSLDRHKRAVRTADLYMERCKNLTDQPNLPEVMFLRAQAMEELGEHQAAADGYSETANRFPKHEISSRAEFMAAYNILQLEDYDQAGVMLEILRKKISAKDEMWPHVVFWRGMAFYFAQHWEKARGIFEGYLNDVADGETSSEYEDDARFRIAYSVFSEARYPEAIDLFQDFERDYATSEWLPEALLAMGDALAGEGNLEQADRAYARISNDAPGFHDEGWMKRGNILKVQKDFAGMKALFRQFLIDRAESPRIAEALHWLGWIEKQQGDPGAAREMYWDAIEKFGNDPVRPGLEDIFLTLPSLYPATEREEWMTRYRDLLTLARDGGKRRLAVRLGWALAQSHGKSKEPGVKPISTGAREQHTELAALVPLIDAKQTAPRVLADVADALLELDDPAGARTMYDDLRKWWPRAPERDRAYAGLGFLAAGEGEELQALEWFDRYEKTSVMPRTAADDHGIVLVQGELGGKVAMERAKLLSSRDPEKALHILLAVQKNKSMPTKTRAEALMKTANLHVAKERYRESLPYFEQIYILYNRHPDLVADAYFGRGQSLEKLGLSDKAREVYSELVNRSDLAGFDAARAAAERARALGGVIPPSNPEGSIIPPESP